MAELEGSITTEEIFLNDFSLEATKKRSKVIHRLGAKFSYACFTILGRVPRPAIFQNEDRKRFSTSGTLERSGRTCAAFSRLVGGRVTVNTCCAFRVGLSEFLNSGFQLCIERKKIFVLRQGSDDIC